MSLHANSFIQSARYVTANVPISGYIYNKKIILKVYILAVIHI